MNVEFLNPISYQNIKIGQKYFCAELNDKACVYFECLDDFDAKAKLQFVLQHGVISKIDPQSFFWTYYPPSRIVKCWFAEKKND